MDHPRNDVLPRTTLTLDQDGHVGSRNLVKAFTDGVHGIGPPKNNGLRGNFTDRLD